MKTPFTILILFLIFTGCATVMTPEKKAAGDRAVEELIKKFRSDPHGAKYGPHRVTGSDGEKYIVSEDGSGRLVIQREVWVGFGSMAYQDCGTRFAYQYNNLGEIWKVFELVGENWKFILTREYVEDQSGDYIGALLTPEESDSLSSKEIEKKVLLMNATDRKVLLGNYVIQKYMQRNRFRPGMPEYDYYLKQYSEQLKMRYEALGKK
jgi:hypothetical protein